MMFANFHVCGMMLLFSDMLYILVIYVICLKCLMLTLSCPVEFVFFCFVLLPLGLVLSVIMVVYSLCVFLYICLFVLCVFCFTVLMNCLLKEFAICMSEVTVLSLSAIVLFLGCIVFLLANPYSVCALCL